MAKVPLVDIRWQYEQIKPELYRLWDEAFENMQLVLGKNVQEFEKEFASYIGTKHAVGVGSGTDAITLSLMAIGIKPGDEVITVSQTFIATINPIILLGGVPKLVDIDPETYTIDVSKINITPRTKAIIPVHLYGHPANMAPLLELARKHNLHIIEDSSQAHGAQYKFPDGSVKNIGTIGNMATWSFYFSKNLSALGEAGAVTTNNDDLANRLKMIRNHGRLSKFKSDLIGFNSRLDEMQAAVLRLKLKKLDQWNNQRREAAKNYKSKLKDIVKTPTEREWAKHVYHCFVIETERREKLIDFLKSKEIETGIHYPCPCHNQPSLKEFLPRDFSLPVTERICERILSLPIYPGITSEQIEIVCKAISEFHS